MAFQITKAVIPAAGLGTRFLPATKAMPKEMLPVVDKPAIQYVVEEAVAAGLTDVLMITGRNKSALENHFDRVGELEAALLRKGDTVRLQKVNYSTDLAEVHYVRQGDPLGLGHAVLRARMHVGNQPFAVLLGDDLIDARDVLLSRMLEVQAEKNCSVVALLEVEPSQAHLYGIATIEGAAGAAGAEGAVGAVGAAGAAGAEGAVGAVGANATDGDVVRVTGMVEKPAEGTEPSNLAIIGRYVLRPEIFDILEETAAGKGGEIQLTDALQTLAANPEIAGGVYGVIFRGRRYDTGDRVDYIKAIVQLAVDRDDLGPELRPWLKKFAAKMAD